MKYIFKRDSPCQNPYCLIGDYKYSIYDYRGDVFRYRDYGSYKYALVFQKILPHEELDFKDIKDYRQWVEMKNLTEYFYSSHGNITTYLLYNKEITEQRKRVWNKALWKASVVTTHEYVKDEDNEIVDVLSHVSAEVVQLHPLYLIRDEFLLYKDCLEFAQVYLNKRFPENDTEQLNLF